MTRDKLYALLILITTVYRTESQDVINELFFDKIFDMLLETDDERNKLKSFEILCNLIHSEEQRSKMANENYF